MVAVRSEGRQPVQAKLHEVSVTGAVGLNPKLLNRATLWKLYFRQARVSFAVWLSSSPQEGNQNQAACKPSDSEDEDPTRLRMTLESHRNQTLIGSWA